MTMHAHPAYFSDAEVDEICAGLTQDAAKIRFLRRLGLRVDRKPNGRPLAWRPASAPADRQNAPQDDASIVVGLQAWATARKGRNGQKAQVVARRPYRPGSPTKGEARDPLRCTRPREMCDLQRTWAGGVA